MVVVSRHEILTLQIKKKLHWLHDRNFSIELVSTLFVKLKLSEFRVCLTLQLNIFWNRMIALFWELTKVGLDVGCR